MISVDITLRVWLYGYTGYIFTFNALKIFIDREGCLWYDGLEWECNKHQPTETAVSAKEGKMIKENKIPEWKEGRNILFNATADFILQKIGRVEYTHAVREAYSWGVITNVDMEILLKLKEVIN